MAGSHQRAGHAPRPRGGWRPAAGANSFSSNRLYSLAAMAAAMQMSGYAAKRKRSSLWGIAL